MAGELGQYIARQGGPTGTAGAVELVTGTVLTWSAGDRTVDVFGVAQAVKYAADIVAAVAPGDTVAVLRTAGDHLVICKVADA